MKIEDMRFRCVKHGWFSSVSDCKFCAKEGVVVNKPKCKCGREIVENKIHYCEVVKNDKNEYKCHDCGEYCKCLSEHTCQFKGSRFEQEDSINKPNHYHNSGVDPIALGEKMFTKEEMNGFYKMNMLKYWYRAGKKEGNSKEQDLKKYEFYKNKLEGNM